MANFVTLKNRLDSYVDRQDVDYTANRDYFINLAIRQLARELQVESNIVELIVSQSISAGADSFTMPDALRHTTDSQLVLVDSGGQKSKMWEIPVKFLNEEFYDGNAGFGPEGTPVTSFGWINYAQTTAPGRPRHYAIGTLAGARIIHVRPIADATYAVEIRGHRYSTDLSLDTDSNYLTLEFEDAVLYMAVAEVWSFFEDAGRFNFWAQKASPFVAKAKAYRAHEALSNYGGKLQMGTYAAGGVVEGGGWRDSEWD